MLEEEDDIMPKRRGSGNVDKALQLRGFDDDDEPKVP